MQDFNDIQNLWKQEENASVSKSKVNFKIVKSYQRKLRNTYLRGAIILLLTSFYLIVMLMLFDEKIKTVPVVASVILIFLLCIFQSTIFFLNAKKINKIDETQTPSKHLKQWQDFNEFRKNQTRINLPIYYILLTLALVVYLFQILKNADFTFKIIAISATVAWILFAYFYLGKRNLKKMDAKFDAIIGELKNLENQFL